VATRGRLKKRKMGSLNRESTATFSGRKAVNSVSGSWELPSISGRSNSGCSWEIESQKAVSGGRPPSNIQRTAVQLLAGEE
jgi:hypothetical protein